MDFLRQSQEDFVKLQLTDMLLRPTNRKKIKSKLKKIGLYTQKEGFLHYKDFIYSELPSFDRTAMLKSRNKNIRIRNTTHLFRSPINQPKNHRRAISNSSPLSRGQAINRVRIGIVNTKYFRKNRISVISCTLYVLFSKINPLESPEWNIPNNKKISPIKHDFVYEHITLFLHVARHLNSILPNIPIQVSSDIRKQIQSAFSTINSSTPKKLLLKHKDPRIINYINQKGYCSVLAEPLNKFFFKRYPTFNEQFFEEFISTYILTNILSNQLKLCFEIYNRNSGTDISAKDIFIYFESPFFPFITNDIFAMSNGIIPLCHENTSKFMDLSSQSLPDMKNQEQFTVKFKEFIKLPFTQKFPDILLAISYILLGEFSAAFLCNHFNLPKYKVISFGNELSVKRISSNYLNYSKILDTQWLLLKPELKSYDFKPGFDINLLKYAASTFLLACDIDSICNDRIFHVTSASFKEASPIILGRYCPTITQRIFNRMSINNSSSVSIWEFIDYIEGYYDKETVHQRMFDIFDINGDREVSVLEFISLIATEETKVCPALDFEVNLISDVLEEKRRLSEPGKGSIRLQQYINLIPNPGFPDFLENQMKNNHKNRSALAQKRLQI
ncbi:unnamed protein product [Blepharisma stoltei]|uniref:EF-hand domain-containing protein n=1 Tax=Blepharisma stoltei TaxID=1481888 RepID=A0AAU9JX47_9CILI|nr:unnamed protein product [Blepharisma stoltei]